MSNKLFKNVSKFTGDKKGRDILQSFSFSDDGNIYATNSHVAIMLKGYNKSKAKFNFNPKSLEQSEEDYPSLERIFPTEFDYKIEFNLKLIDQLLSLLKPYKKEQCNFTFTEGNLEININNLLFNISLPYIYSETFEIYFNVHYLIISLETYKDEYSPFILKIKSPFRPVLFESDKINIIVSPIRNKDSLNN